MIRAWTAAALLLALAASPAAAQNLQQPLLGGLGFGGSQAQAGAGWQLGSHFDGSHVQGVQDAVKNVLNRYQSALGGLTSGIGNLGGLNNGLNNLGGAAAQWNTNLQAQYKSLSEQLDILTAQYEAQYCTPARFEKSVKRPAKFVGPSFAITFDSGACSFDDKAWKTEHKKQLNCTEPSITHIKIPANFTSKFHSAPKFVNKECAIAKVFGDTYSRVLFVFDGQNKLDVRDLTQKITEEVRQAVTALTPQQGAQAGGAGPNLWTGNFGGQPGSGGLGGFGVGSLGAGFGGGFGGVGGAAQAQG